VLRVRAVGPDEPTPERADRVSVRQGLAPTRTRSRCRRPVAGTASGCEPPTARSSRSSPVRLRSRARELRAAAGLHDRSRQKCRRRIRDPRMELERFGFLHRGREFDDEFFAAVEIGFDPNNRLVSDRLRDVSAKTRERRSATERSVRDRSLRRTRLRVSSPGPYRRPTFSRRMPERFRRVNRICNLSSLNGRQVAAITRSLAE
jgi:hypothetical protein